MANWFTILTGFQEDSSTHVRVNALVDGTQLISQVNGSSYKCGQLEIPALRELQKRIAATELGERKLRVTEIVGNAQVLHSDVENAGATFQVASQFNLLEMISPQVTPEHGVAIYENDPTQGPACAVACGAGTIYRNYFVEVDGQIGQTADKQIDCLADLGAALGNSNGRLWKMQNGYALPSREGLEEVHARLSSMSETQLDELRSLLRVGVHSNVQVTIDDCKHSVTQVYCSALPVAYSHHSAELWKPFAQLILDAAYEATFCAAAINAARSGNNRLFLTLLGGGAFGNDEEWIVSAIQRSLTIFRNIDLDVRIVSFRRSNPKIRQLIT